MVLRGVRVALAVGIFVCLLAVPVALGAQALLPDEADAFVDLINAFNSPSATPSGWQLGATPGACSWQGVTCAPLNATHQTVTELYANFSSIPACNMCRTPVCGTFLRNFSLRQRSLFEDVFLLY